jgi:proteasome lid subunit RPN8/RPN11
MIAHAETVYPEECCGLLLGVQAVEPDDRTVNEVQPLTNDWTEDVNPFADRDRPTQTSKRNRYWVDPKALMEAQRYGRDRGWIILGVYHSHPDHPAVPSERDRQLAWSEYSYPILSIVDGKLAALHSWRLSDKGQFQEEVITVPSL